MGRVRGQFLKKRSRDNWGAAGQLVVYSYQWLKNREEKLSLTPPKQQWLIFDCEPQKQAEDTV